MTNLSVPIPYLWSHPLSKGFRRFFYLMLPSESSFEYEDDVPDYVNQVGTPEQILIIIHSRNGKWAIVDIFNFASNDFDANCRGLE